MFTGIIDHCGIIRQVEKTQAGLRLEIATSFTHIELGESIAVDGICLTADHVQNSLFSCDISPETLQVTTARYFTAGQTVNLERSLQLSSRLGGHMVMGHIDQVVWVKHIQKTNEFVEIVFAGLNPLTQKFITQKGSIAINGVSLTINHVFEDGFDVMLVPHTLAKTNLSQLSSDDKVNIEFDQMARIVVEQCERYLREHNLCHHSI